MTGLAWALVIAPVLNVYFVWHGFRSWLRDPGRSAILFAIFVVKLLAWLVGLAVGILAARFLLDLPVLGYDGILLGAALVIVDLLPAVLHLAIVRYERL